MSNEINSIINEIYMLKKNNSNMMKNISINKNKINNLECDLWEKCDHQFIYDESANFDDRTKYICKICNCYRNPYYYRRR